jgi:murein DD-endopeptidase MepM/ murein hydrolase activator NlpD
MRTLILLLLLLVTAACTLNTGRALPTTTAIVLEPTLRPTATDTPRPTNTPLPTATSGACVPRSDWTIFYTVVAGDTLGSIALRTNSTTAQLAAANCLTNPNNIVVGQQLRVPRVPSAPLPPTATRTPTITPTLVTPQPYPEPVGRVGFSSYLSGDAGFYYLVRGQNVLVGWDEAPGNVYHATFYLMAPGQTSTTVIGEDSNPGDGFLVSWTVPAGLNGHQVYAIGRVINNPAVIASYSSVVASARPTNQGCFVSAAIPEGEPIYANPDPSAQIVGTLWPDSNREILGQALNGWFAFDSGIPPSGGTNGVWQLHWVPVDAQLKFSGVCEG